MKELLKNTRNLTFLGVMFGLSIVLLFATMIPGLGASVAVVMFLPTIITGIIKGPKAGWLMGTAVGIVIMLRAMIAPLSVLDPLFINPLVSVVPRMFIGIVSYYVFSLLAKNYTALKKNGKNTARVAISSALAGAFGMITNTVLVMSALYIFYASKIVEILGMGFKAFLMIIITSNATVEAISGAIFTMAIITVYYRTKR